jgi:hypothetical protein
MNQGMKMKEYNDWLITFSMKKKKRTNKLKVKTKHTHHTYMFYDIEFVLHFVKEEVQGWYTCVWLWKT